MRAVIIEDELLSARRLERMLVKLEIENVITLSSVKQSIKWFQKNKHPEVLFLDIQLADGLCFEIFNKVAITSKIIFTTAYSDYSIKAFDYNSFSYLLKPIKEPLLEKAVFKARDFVKKEQDLAKLQQLLLSYETEIYKESFTVKIGTKIKIIKVSKIECFYSFDNASYVKTATFNGIINSSLETIKAELNPKLFFRVNRTFIVQKRFIKEIIAYSNSRLKIILQSYNESEIIVSRERVKDFKNWID